MKTRFNIAVCVGFEISNQVASIEAFDSLQEVAFELGLIGEKRRVSDNKICGFNALGEFPSSAFDEFVGALAKLGFQPRFGSAQDVPEGFFFVDLENIYSEEDLDAAEYLYITSFCETTLEAEGCEDGVWRVYSVSFHEEEQENHDHTQVGAIPLVGPKLKEKLEREHFLALELPEVKWFPDGTRPADLWQMHSSLTMPPCMTKIVDDGGVAFFKEDNGAKNARIEFDKDAVAALGGFDIAMIREKLGNINPIYTHFADNPKYIISQRLRKFFLANNIQAEFGVVRFV